MSDEELLRDLDRASTQVKKQLGTNAGGSSAEKNYGQAYTACVRAGLKPKLKGKYR